MARLNAQQAAEKWARKAGQATTDYNAGVERVTQAPGQLAAAKADKMLTGVQSAIGSGKWAQNTARVTLAEWKQATVNKGGARYAQGVSESQGKMANAMTRVLANVDAAVGAIASMPDTTFEQRMARMQRYAQEMHARSTSGR